MNREPHYICTVIIEWTDVVNQSISFLFNRHIEDLHNACKLLTGKPVNRSYSIYLSYHGTLFGVLPSPVHIDPKNSNNRSYNVSFYDTRGTHSLGGMSHKVITPNSWRDEKWPEEEIHKMIEIFQKYSNGYIQCHFCKEFVPRTEAKPFPFAGMSCNKDECVDRIPKNIKTN